MKSVNKITLVGYVGGSESFTITEVANKESGEIYKVANFSLATTRKYMKSDEKKEETQWHRIVAWGRLAEIIADYVESGQPLYIEGRVEYRKYTTEDGITKWMTEIRANDVSILPRREKPTETTEPTEPTEPQDNGKKKESKRRAAKTKKEKKG